MKTRALLKFVVTAVAGMAGLASLPKDALAIPTLQLGIENGVYDTTTETVFATSSSFALYAFLIPDADNILGDTYFVSMAVTPMVSTPADLGSFSYNSTTVDVTDDMAYGTPPLDGLFDDIATHSVFATYYKEVAFTFDSSNTSTPFNTQDNPSWGPQTSGTGMYFNRFDIDTSNLASGYQIHFDLYNSNLKEKCKKGDCVITSDNTQFAPFSHDAQSFTSSIPEPETYAMLLAGLGLMGAIARRHNRKSAVD